LLGPAIAVGTVVLLLGGLYAVDQYLHAKHDAYETPNSQGYRGPILQSKAPGEMRIALVGESSAYGYGLINEYSLGSKLEDRLQADLNPRPVSVVNLAGNGDSSPCYAPTLAHYDWLEPDVVVIHAGYNDNPSTLGRPVSTCYRQRNRIFALTGYWPVTDTYVREKLYTIIYGSAERGYVAAGQIPPIMNEPGFIAGASADAAGQAISDFSANIVALIEGQLALGRSVVYLTQPYLNTYHRRQQVAMRDALARFANNSRFAYIDLGDAIDLSDSDMSFDRMHPTGEGNDVLSSRLAPVIERLVQERT
jgi:lysophospholipase L1-like esterase